MFYLHWYIGAGVADIVMVRNIEIDIYYRQTVRPSYSVPVQIVLMLPLINETLNNATYRPTHDGLLKAGAVQKSIIVSETWTISKHSFLCLV